MAIALGERRAELTLRERLKEILEFRRMKPAALARASKLDPSTIHRILSGERTRIELITIIKIANGLGMSVDELTGGVAKNEVIDEEFARDLALRFGGPIEDWLDFADIAEGYAQLDKAQREQTKEWVQFLAGRRNRELEQGEREVLEG